MRRDLIPGEREFMNSRERMLAAIHHEKPDRGPTDLWATPEVMGKIHAHFGTGIDWRQALHIDGMAGVGPEYIGPPLPQMPAGETVSFWGLRTRRMDYGMGTYDETCFHPLAAAQTIDDLERYEWPSADWFDYSKMRKVAAEQHDSHAIQCGYMAPFYYHNLLRGLERSLTDPHDDAAFTKHLLTRLCDFFFEHHLRIFEACGGLIDVAQVTDDYGSQTGPMIGLETFREFYKPHLKRMIDLCHGFGIKVMHHDDGAIRDFLPDLIEIGIEILNPIQWTCPGMELKGLKRDFGKTLCFHGGIDNQKILPFGTPEEVRAEVRHCIDDLAADGTGYILAPCHCIQPVSPMENIIAMCDEAWHYGEI
jgi:uroporphyrinogen decarboxylase